MAAVYPSVYLTMLLTSTQTITRMFAHPLLAHISIIMYTPEPRISVNILMRAMRGTYAKLTGQHLSRFLTAITFKPNFMLYDSNSKQKLFD